MWRVGVLLSSSSGYESFMRVVFKLRPIRILVLQRGATEAMTGSAGSCSYSFEDVIHDPHSVCALPAEKRWFLHLDHDALLSDAITAIQFISQGSRR